MTGTSTTIVGFGPKGKAAAQQKANAIRQFRKEASRKAALANKRIARLESNDLKSSPAYQRFIEDGGHKFGVKGKTYNEVQQEVARLDRFINAVTSTVKGATNTLKEMAKNTGISYKNMADLKKKSAKFFELASKVEQYLRNVEDVASAIGYQKIWEAVNQYVKDSGITLDNGEADIDSMVESVSKALATFDSMYQDPVEGWYAPNPKSGQSSGRTGGTNPSDRVSPSVGRRRR